MAFHSPKKKEKTNNEGDPLKFNLDFRACFRSFVPFSAFYLSIFLAFVAFLLGGPLCHLPSSWAFFMTGDGDFNRFFYCEKSHSLLPLSF
mmetsp:Transcript_46893/g.54083  ORF Transcript_46893/g.54083 Transcript_46893/m.54083 type:complete len:90 (+) Transcript_46893:847-1116(+)